MPEKIKKHETIGCCGIDCGLCPRFYTRGDSACPGCGGLNFKEKHPSCGFLSCCAIKKGHEVCAQCVEYPCKRFEVEKEGYDSFVTHARVFPNQQFIKDNGIEPFMEAQKFRMELLHELLAHFDDGRSKSFYCLGCALLPQEALVQIKQYAECVTNVVEVKARCSAMKEFIIQLAQNSQIELGLRPRK